MTRDRILGSDMRDEKTTQQRLEQLRGQFLQWGTPELPVLVTTKDKLRGWFRALEWVLLKPSASVTREVLEDVRRAFQNTPKDQ
jgi:hypothetical protein